MRRHIQHFLLALAAALATLHLLSMPDPAHSADAGAAPPRVVNVTTDSKPGWTPPEEMERAARAAATAYLAALDAGKYDEAYAFIADLDRTDQPLPVFTGRAREFNALAGAVIERRIVTVTWTKDSPKAPLPGTFVALDLVSRFANVDRHCGYLVLYQAPSGGDFKVMREESNYVGNATAADIAKKSGAAAVDEAWATLSAHCPGYQAPLPEASAPTISYPSVAAALAALHAKAGVVFRNQNGWTIAEDDLANTIWSFTPPGDPAFPAVVKREVLEKDGAVYLQMSVRCEASKAACDNLVRAFNQLNAQAGASLHNDR